jgi:histidinol-phosphate aminotransferase
MKQQYPANPWIQNLSVYEPGKPIEEVARELGIADIDSIAKLASNENALGPSPKAVKAMIACATQMHRYPDGGAYYLRQALARTFAVDMDTLILGTGSNELIELIAHVFLRKGTNIVMADRAFVVYRLVAAAEEAATLAVPMKGGMTHDLKAMLKAITPDTRVVFIANPNNPTGTYVEPSEIDRYMDRVPDHVLTVFDEAYIELMPRHLQPDTLRFVREGRKVILLRTFSKAYGLAGLRIGYGIGEPGCISLLHRVRQPFNVNAMAQAAAIAALDDEAFVNRTRRLVQQGLAYFEAECARAGLQTVPSVANFLLIKTGKGREVFKALQEQKVIVRPMDGYGLPDYVRVTVGTRAENVQCMKALRKVLGIKGARATP